MRFLNRFDSAKPIGVTALLAIFLLVIALFSSNNSVRRAFLFVSIVVFSAALVLSVRGVFRRIYLVNKRLEALDHTIARSSQQSMKQKLLLEKIEQHAGLIPAIAGSVSKGRNLQVAMSGIITQLASGEKRQVAQIHSPKEPDLPQQQSQSPTPLILDNRNGHHKELQQKQWQLDHELVLPHNVGLKNEQFLSHNLPLTSRTRAAVIMDPFSYGSFSPELDVVPLHPETWRQQIEEHNAEVFICESAWQGVPAKEHPWKARVYSSVRFNYENRKPLLQILEYCKSRGIPTVFWNKEDPTHFADRVNDFVNTARLFDFIFTTAEEMIPNYNKLTGKSSAACLPFAVQPRIFHPALSNEATKDDSVVFAGSWYKNHANRRRLQKHLFDEVLARGLKLDIYDRYYGQDNEQFGFPNEYQQFTHPAIPYEKTASVYQSYRYGLSINTVTDSKTMLARRAFEMAAAGCGIITNGTPATKHFFGEKVLELGIGDKLSDSALQTLDDSRLPLMNEVLEQHTYEVRTKKILDTVGIESISATERVTVVVWVNSLNEITAAKKKFSALGKLGGGLILLVSKEVESHRVQEFYKVGIDSKTSVVSEEYWLERGIRPQTLFDLPLLYVASSVHVIDKPEQIQRAMRHAIYSKEPVKPSASPVWPRLGFDRVDNGVVMQVSAFDYFMKNDFSERMLTIV